MPIYEYRCPKCRNPRETILPMSERDNPQICLCGEIMTRIMSLPQPPIMVVTNRDNLVKSLNNEAGGYKFPGEEKHGERYKAAIGRSLTQEKPVIGRGFTPKT